jgi:hypothetical protein
MSRFKDNMIAIDLKSFIKTMGCEFSDAFIKHFKSKQNNIGHLLTTSIRTDGYSIQFIKRVIEEVPMFFKQKMVFNDKNQKWEIETKMIQKGRSFDIESAYDKPSFDLIKAYTSLPNERGTRVLTQVTKDLNNQKILNDLGKCTLDPGKKQVYTVLNDENKKVSMSKERQSHLRLTHIFTKIEINNRTKLGYIIEDLSKCSSFTTYLPQIHIHFNTLRQHYSTKTCKKLRFKRAQIEQKLMDLMYKEIQHGEILATNMKWNDFKRKNTKYKKVLKDKNKVIYYGDGSYKHNTFGCRSIMNKKLIYGLSRKTLVIMTPEFRTSKTCCACLHLNEDDEYKPIVLNGIISKKRLRQCTHCFVIFDRDINAVFNIMDVVEHYIKNNEMPDWQKRSL